MKKIGKMLMILILTAIALLLAGVFYVRHTEQEARQQNLEKADIALVLGNAVNRRGKPNPCLHSRVAKGVELYHQGLAEWVLMSGGTDSDGSNEAESMREIAIKLGMPSEKILIENQSESTYENIALSRPLIGDKPNIILVSDAFHLARANWLAKRHWQSKRIQLAASAECGDKPLSLWRKRLRETLAWVKAWALHR